MSDDEIVYEISCSSEESDLSAQTDGDADVNYFARPDLSNVDALQTKDRFGEQASPYKRRAVESVAQVEQQARRDTPYPHVRPARFVGKGTEGNPAVQSSLGGDTGNGRTYGSMYDSTGAPIYEPVAANAAGMIGQGGWWTPPSQERPGYLWSRAPGTPLRAEQPGTPKVRFASTPQVKSIPPVWKPSPVLANQTDLHPLQTAVGKQRYVYHNSLDSGFGSQHSSPWTTNSGYDASNERSTYLDSLLSSASHHSPVSRCVFRPKKFNGKNWVGYKWHFLHVAQVNGWSPQEAARMLKACLSDSVALLLRKSLRREDATLSDLFRALDERYDVPGPDYVLKGKVRRTLQQPGQSVDDYQTELIKVLSGRLDAEDSEAGLEQFIYGLNDPKMQKHVGKRRPADLHDALRIAREYEETSSWVASATRTAHKRIGLIAASRNDDTRAQQTSQDKPSTSRERTLAGDIDRLFEKIDALELHNQQFRKNREQNNSKWKFQKWKKWGKNKDSNDANAAQQDHGEQKSEPHAADNKGGKQQD